MFITSSKDASENTTLLGFLYDELLLVVMVTNALNIAWRRREYNMQGNMKLL